ncbi:MAG: ATP-binding protein, partial [Comamonas sp.]
MNEEVLARVFDMFFTTKPEGKGAGLGLPMVKNFIDHVHGLIEVESTPGLGTTVSLYFPRAQPLPASPDPHESSAEGKQAAILLIEPDLDTRNAMAQRLYEQGYGVVTAYQPEVALRYISNGMKVDLIIVSDQVPGLMSVAQMQEKLRQEERRIPIIFTTGAAPTERPEASECVALPKPLDMDQLARTVQELLDANRADPAESPFDQSPA